MTALIIEDDRIFAEMFAEVLKQWRDISVDFAESVAEAREKFMLHDVVFLDLKLRNSEGIETVRRVREIVGGAPIVVVTGNPDLHLAEESAKLGARHYLDKSALTEKAIAGVLEDVDDYLCFKRKYDAAKAQLNGAFELVKRRLP